MAVAISYVGGTQNSSTLSYTISWPSHQSGDIAFLSIETANQPLTVLAGWNYIGSVSASTLTALSVFWKRATSSSMPSTTIADVGDHSVSVMTVYRGVSTGTFPYDVSVGVLSASKATASTTTTLPTIVTTKPNSMPWWAMVNPLDSSANDWIAISSSTMGDLAAYVAAQGTTSGNGGQVMVAHPPPLATAGSSTGTTTATLQSSQVDASFGLALLDAAEANTVVPTLLGTSSASTNAASASVTCNYPAESASGDLLVMQVAFHRSTTSGSQTMTTPTGWTLLTSDNQSSAVGLMSETYWRFRGAETSVTATCSNATSEYAAATIHAYKADTVDPTTPVSQYASTYSSTSTSSATRSAPSVTTASANNAISIFVTCNESASFTTRWETPEVVGQTDLYSGSNGDINQATACHYKLAAGATGTYDWNPNGALADESVSATIAIQPIQTLYKNSTDTAAGADSAKMNSALGDASTGSDPRPGITAGQPASDTGAGADPKPTITVRASESGGAADSAVVIVRASESAGGAETAGGLYSPAVVDAGAFAETAVSSSAIQVSDGGTATDSVAGITVRPTDGISGGDTVVPMDVDLNGNDVSTAADSASVLFKANPDAAAGSDSARVTARATDAATGTDSAKLSVVQFATDLALGTDSATVIVWAQPDTGSGDDSAFVFIEGVGVVGERVERISSEDRTIRPFRDPHVFQIQPENRLRIFGREDRTVRPAPSKYDPERVYSVDKET